jgi:undecaprenyl-diphosphatase
MVATACYSYVAYLAWRRWRGLLRVVVVAVCVGVIFLVGLSRMYLGVHYLTDVVAGVLVGLLWAEVVMLAEQILERRRSSSAVTA